MNEISNELTPIGEQIKIYTESPPAKDTTTKIATTSKAIYHTFQVSEYSTTECSSIIPCFGIEDDINSSLVITIC